MQSCDTSGWVSDIVSYLISLPHFSLQLRKCSASSRRILTWSIWRSVNLWGPRRQAISSMTSGTSGNPSDEEYFFVTFMSKAVCQAVIHSFMFLTVKHCPRLTYTSRTMLIFKYLNALLLIIKEFINIIKHYHKVFMRRIVGISPTKWLFLH